MSSSLDLKAIEKAIECIDGVLQVKVVGDNAIEEIHVLSRPTKTPKLLVRDIETVLKTRFNLSIDHKKVSVVTFDVDEESEEKLLLRPILWGLTWKKSLNEVRVEVEVKLQDQIFKGISSEETLHTKNHHLLIAHAAICCINQMVGDGVFSVYGVSLHHLGEVEVALVFVDYKGPKKMEEMLVGSALVRDDVHEAVARATLDAVNRKFTFYREHLGGEQGGSG
ncbi:MAG: hypothetical protein ACUVQZ_06040 [Candidatus Caldatribacteriaceae bacterium]